MTKHSPFRYFKTSPEIIRLAVMMYVRFPLSLRNVEDLLQERGIDICHKTVRYWWNRFGPMLAAEIRKRRVQSRAYSNPAAIVRRIFEIHFVSSTILSPDNYMGHCVAPSCGEQIGDFSCSPPKL